jgi:hypothetical protein
MAMDPNTGKNSRYLKRVVYDHRFPDHVPEDPYRVNLEPIRAPTPEPAPVREVTPEQRTLEETRDTEMRGLVEQIVAEQNPPTNAEQQQTNLQHERPAWNLGGFFAKVFRPK